MKKNLPLIFSGAALALALLCLIQLFSIKSRLAEVRQNVISASNAISDVRASVSGVYGDVRRALEEQASLLSSFSLEHGSFDVSTRKAQYVCTVYPREFSPDKTTATLTVNGEALPMELKDGAFTALVTLPLFSESVISKVAFETDGVLRTEVLDRYVTPYPELLPEVYASFAGSNYPRPCDGGCVITFDGGVDVSAYSQADYKLGHARIVCSFNGEEVSRTPLSSDDVPATPENTRNFHAYYPLPSEFTVPAGGTFELFFEIEDANGFCYRSLIARYFVDSAGQAEPDSDEWIWQGNSATIYGANGELLFDAGQNQ